MKKVLFLLAFVLLLGSVAEARPVDAATARRVADTYMRAMGMAKPAQLADVTAETPFTEFYVFAAPEGGFVLVSGDDCAVPVLGWSLTSRFDAKGMPEHVRVWLEGYEQEIRFQKRKEAQAGNQLMERSFEVAEQWRRLMSGEMPLTTISTSVSPLLSTTWDQYPIYNNLCPYSEEEEYTGNHRVVTGCVATATAQVMKYWNYPTTGYGSHSYYHENVNVEFGMQSADFGATTYQWDSMPTALTSASSEGEINAVATLMYHLGVADEMDYDLAVNGGSGATNYNIFGDVSRYASSQTSLMKYFKYSPDMVAYGRDDYDDEEYTAYLRAELDQSRPILYSGSGSGGHSFVLDGYNTQNQFNINWGWSGSYDGYFTMGALTPGGGGAGSSSDHQYSYFNVALVGIRPNADWTTADSATTVNVSWTGDGDHWVDGTGTYNFGDTVNVEALADYGYRFAGWSDGSRTNPRQMIATGGTYSFTANFVPMQGDTVGYCGKNCRYASRYNVSGYQNRWGIRLFPSDLPADRDLTAAQLYVLEPGTYTLTVYTGTDSPTTLAASSASTYIGEEDVRQWHTFELITPVELDTTQTVWITFTCPDANYPATATTWSGRYDGFGFGDDMTFYVNRVSFMIRGILAEHNEMPVDGNCIVRMFPYEQDFDDEPTCWVVNDLNDDDTHWNWNTSSGIGYDGSGCIFMNTQNGANDLIRTPVIVTPGNYTVSWKAKSFWGEDYPESYLVVKVDAGGNVDSLFFEAIGSDDFVDRVASFSVSEGDTVRIGFWAFTESGSYLLIDNVVIAQSGETPPATYTLTVESADPTMGTVSGSGTFLPGATAMLTATPYGGFRFLHWQDGNNDNPRMVTVDGDTTYTAYFELIPVGDTVYYGGPEEYLNSMSVDHGSRSFYWGMMIPASALTGRNYVNSVMFYNHSNITYTLYIYQGGSEAPETLVHFQPYTPANDDFGWKSVQMDAVVPIDQTQNLWVMFYSQYAPYGDYGNNPNGTWINYDGTWQTMTSMGYDDLSWLMKCVTSATQPEVGPPSAAIVGESIVAVGTPVTYAAIATASATVTWSIPGATPATATGNALTVTFPTEGIYTLTATATNENGSASASTSVLAVNCGVAVSSYPYTNTVNQSSDDARNMFCWSIVDNDGDGLGWELYQESGWAVSDSWKSNMGALNPDNWLITQEFQLQTNHSYTLTWNESAGSPGYYAEHYGVYISTNGSSPQDFTLLQDYTLTSAASTGRTLDLSAYAGNTVRLAFRHWQSSDVMNLRLGNFQITETENPVQQYTLTVTSANPDMGTVTGSGTYDEGTEVQLRASSNPGYHFVSWNDQVTDSVRTVTVTGDATYTASFAPNVGIDDIDLSTIELYPNPASSTVTLTGLPATAKVTLVDMNGRKNREWTVKEGKETFDVSTLAPGAYFLRIVTDRTSAVRKLIVKH